MLKNCIAKGISPEITRTIIYTTEYPTKESETERLSLERLERIVDKKEPLPELNAPVISSMYWGIC